MKIIKTLRKGTLVLLLILFSSNIFAQSKVKEPKKFSDKIFFGGTIGMVFGNVTRVDVLPQVGMWVLPQWAIGFGGRYSYRKESYWSSLDGETEDVLVITLEDAGEPPL